MKVFVPLFFFILAFSSPAQSTADKHHLSDSCMVVLKKMNLEKDWTLHKTGSRITLTKKDSILVATSYSDYKPGNPEMKAGMIKHQYQMYIDLIEKPLDFNRDLHKTVNDSIDKIIRSFKKKKYTKGEYFSHLEAIELLESMKIKEDISLSQINIRFSNNCASDWIPYEISDIKYLPFEPPTGLMKKFEALKLRIAERLKDEGI